MMITHYEQIRVSTTVLVIIVLVLGTRNDFSYSMYCFLERVVLTVEMYYFTISQKYYVSQLLCMAGVL
jgi:hypothetical protein